MEEENQIKHKEELESKGKERKSIYTAPLYYT